MITFVYNPIEKMVEAAQNIYPGISAEIQFNPEIKDSGSTSFPNKGGAPLIDINTELSFSEAVETIAHELAHVAVNTLEHNVEWKKASDKILAEFSRIVSLRLNDYKKSKK